MRSSFRSYRRKNVSTISFENYKFELLQLYNFEETVSTKYKERTTYQASKKLILVIMVVVVAIKVVEDRTFIICILSNM